jgi:hypothetical protein
MKFPPTECFDSQFRRAAPGRAAPLFCMRIGIVRRDRLLRSLGFLKLDAELQILADFANPSLHSRFVARPREARGPRPGGQAADPRGAEGFGGSPLNSDPGALLTPFAAPMIETLGGIDGALSKSDGCFVGTDLAGRGRATSETGAEKAKRRKRSPGCPGGGASACATAAHGCQAGGNCRALRPTLAWGGLCAAGGHGRGHPRRISRSENAVR